MTERASFQTSGGGGGSFRTARMVNGVPTWQDLTEAEMAAYTPPPSDKYHVKIVGFGEPFKKPKKAEWIKEGGPTEDTVSFIEFEIQEGKGKGKRFSSRVNCVVGAKSHLGQVWLAAIGPIKQPCELMDLLEKECIIYVERNEGTDSNGNKKVYANPTWSTAKAVGSEDSADDGWPAAS